jgi:hypothetical protein
MALRAHGWVRPVACSTGQHKIVGLVVLVTADQNRTLFSPHVQCTFEFSLISLCHACMQNAFACCWPPKNIYRMQLAMDELSNIYIASTWYCNTATQTKPIY